MVLYLAIINYIYYIKELIKLMFLEKYILPKIFEDIINIFIIPGIFGNWIILNIIIE
jgi:hypothetical protein